jgi:hypothetical protein
MSNGGPTPHPVDLSLLSIFQLFATVVTKELEQVSL